MRKSEINEINEFFNSLGIDNEMLSQMASSYTVSFMVQGEENTKLEEILKRAPESLLDWILENWQEEVDAEVSCENKERTVYDVITESF